jgi:hypothetical protein
MLTQTFQHTYFIHAPASKIYAHLADPNSYMGLSPLLLSITDIHWETNSQQQCVVRYKSVELFRFLGLFTYRNPLDVVMTLTQPDQQIVSDVQTNQNVTVHFVFDMHQQADGTNLTETITAHMPMLLSRFIIGQAKAVQQNRAKVLTQRMENPNQKGE